MSSNQWVFDVQTKIFSNIKNRCIDKFKKDYPKLNITKQNNNVGYTDFPTIYVHFLKPLELGKTLDNSVVNAIELTAEVEVVVSREQGEELANKISLEVLDGFKDFRFNSNMPSFENSTTDYYRSVSRYNRKIGGNDIL